MANCPIRNDKDINYSIDYFFEKNNNFQISCFKYGWMNPWWAHKRNEDGEIEPIFKSQQIKRSQDQEELFCPTGAIWIAKISKLLEHRTFYGPGYDFCEINWKSAVDIDEYEDLEFAKCVQGILNNGK
jgi:N-acylneuraminate cytidylyltransferase